MKLFELYPTEHEDIKNLHSKSQTQQSINQWNKIYKESKEKQEELNVIERILV